MLVEIAVLTILFECVTCLGRFVFRFRSREVKWPVRIHHGYLGVLLLIFWLIFATSWLLMLGSALVLSDVLHHFVVLPLTVGATEFP